MKIKYYYFAVLFLVVAIAGYFFGKGLHSESQGNMPPPLEEPVESEGVESAASSSLQSETETVGGPFPADVLPPEALLGTSSPRE